MRISTANAYSSSIDTLLRRQRDMSDSQAQLTSGKRLIRASDDPAGAAHAERALASATRVEASQRGVQTSEILMTQSEGALTDAGDLLQRARELMIAAGNAIHSDKERLTTSNELRSLREQLLVVANRTDGGRGYLFGGQGSSTPPFLDTPTGVQFRGTAGQAVAADGERLPLTLDGQDVWMQTRTGNGVFETRANVSTGAAWIDSGNVTDPSLVTDSTYTINFSGVPGALTYSILKDGAGTAQTNVPFTPSNSGISIEIDGQAANIKGTPLAGDQFEFLPSTPSLSIFDALDQAVADLAVPNLTASNRAQLNGFSLTNIDAALSRLTGARAEVGNALNQIDSTGSRLASQKLQAISERSNAEDLDMVSAISEFQNKQTGYDAALKSYALVQRLSLFNYVNA
jgi:flagellar hook-associated protein 3 FlgL